LLPRALGHLMFLISVEIPGIRHSAMSPAFRSAREMIIFH